ncbi:MAG: hypothetical protein QME47_07110 [Candidatus Thermoplasmatota archaeon]|nr:hypothetical protein [Candidatus Thermoplasmatota archaeon]
MAVEIDTFGINKFGTERLGFLSPAVLIVNLYDTVRMTITVENNTGETVTKDVMAAYGTYVEAESTFLYKFRAVGTGVAIPSGTYNLVIDATAWSVGTDFDAMAALGTYNATTGEFSVEVLLVKVDQLTVKGVGITDFTLSKV